MAKFFYLKLAWANVRRSREVYLPYMLAAAIICGVYFLVVGMAFAEGLNGVPGGESARMVFSMGVVVFTIFAFCFLFSINSFLVKRRKKEFGLYGVLGLSKGHVGRILLWENALVLLGGLVLGVSFALVFGQLLFLLLLKLMRALPTLAFIPSPLAYAAAGGLILAVFASTTIYNLAQVHLSNPIQLLQTERRGEKDSKLLWPKAILGAALLAVAYYFAWTISNSSLAMGVFFLLVLLVIFATYMLFNAGSIAMLKTLRANKKFYYTPSHFVVVSGMFHRMRQNASSLATICILSTMLTVTLSGSIALYLGQEETLKPRFPYDVCIVRVDEAGRIDLDSTLYALAKERGLAMEGAPESLVYLPYTEEEARSINSGRGAEDSLYESRTNVVFTDSVLWQQEHSLYLDGMLLFDLKGSEAACLSFVEAARDVPLPFAEEDATVSFTMMEVFSARQDGYGIFGGLLFLGAFFSIQFLAVTVLMLYFKQITEGHEDKERFAVLQKVGMDEGQVRRCIDSQVLWVFFLPLATAMLHMLFASRILNNMLRAFTLDNWPLVLSCVGVVCLGFALFYLLVYKLTARVYFRIVKW